MTSNRLVLPIALSAFLFGCSAAPEEAPVAEDPVRATTPAPPAAQEAQGTDETNEGPGDAKPIFKKDAFKEPPATASSPTSPSAPSPSTPSSPSSPTSPTSPTSPYAHLDPNHVVPKVLLDKAVAFFDTNKPIIPNKEFITVVDFKPHSGQKRFFVIDMKSGAVRAQVVAHGKMSDPSWTGYATAFSNDSGSNMSSVGFAITGATYVGTHGRSLRLEGLSPTNSNMFDRAIVIHRAWYVVEGQAKQGRSLGCFVLDEAVTDDIIDMIEGGSLLYAEQS